MMQRAIRAVGMVVLAGLGATPAWSAPAADGMPRILVPAASLAPAAQRQLQVDGNQIAMTVATAAARLTRSPVLTERDARALAETAAQQQQQGCADVGCGMDLARASRVDLLLRVEVGLLGNQVVASGSLVDVRDARVLQVATASFPPADLLTGGLDRMVQALFRKDRPAVTPAASVVLAPPGEPTRVLVMPVQGAPDPATGAALASKAAAVVAKTGNFQSVSQDEVSAILRNQSDMQAVGSDNEELLTRVAQSMKARFLVSLTVGKAGAATLLSGALVDANVGAVVNRSSVTLPDASRLLDGTEVVVRQLLGQEAVLPAPPPDPDRFDAQLGAMAAGMAQAYKALPQGGAAGLAVLPLTEDSQDAQGRGLGKQVASFLAYGLESNHALAPIPADKVQSLARTRSLARAGEASVDELREWGMFLGAQALVVGSVGDVGTDFLVQARLVKLADGSTLWAGHAMFPKAKPGSLMPRKTTVVRSRADSVVRAVIPGFAQLSGGLAQVPKGVVILGVMGASALLATGLVAGTLTALGLGILWSPALIFIPFAPANRDASCVDSSSTNNRCQTYATAFTATAAGLGVASTVPVLVGLAFYVLGFVDAGIFGERREELNFESAP